MKITVTKNMFVEAFSDYGRGNNFTRPAREALYEYLTEIEEGGEEIEFDVISICCDFSEDTLHDVVREHGLDFDGDIDTLQDQVRDQMQERTIVIYCDDETICYANY